MNQFSDEDRDRIIAKSRATLARLDAKAAAVFEVAPSEAAADVLTKAYAEPVPYIEDRNTRWRREAAEAEAAQREAQRRGARTARVQASRNAVQAAHVQQLAALAATVASDREQLGLALGALDQIAEGFEENLDRLEKANSDMRLNSPRKEPRARSSKLASQARSQWPIDAAAASAQNLQLDDLTPDQLVACHPTALRGSGADTEHRAGHFLLDVLAAERADRGIRCKVGAALKASGRG